jgi:hypothetical protein
MSGGFAYFWSERTATVIGSKTKNVECVNCQYRYEYLALRAGVGTGYSPYLLFRRRAERDARERAYDSLRDQLYEAVDLAHCPNCGIYQPDMVRKLQGQFGKDFDPNINANLRLLVSPLEAWNIACKGNSQISYENFKRLWPIYGSIAQEKIQDLRMPRWIRDALWNWSPLAVVAILFAVIFLFAHFISS